MGRAISVTELYSKKRNVLKFEGKWLESFGQPELKGSWIIYGPSRNGKTAFAVQVAKYLTKWSRVFYDSLEEGDSESLKAAFRRQQMEDVKRRVIILDKETIAELRERLSKKKAPKVVIVDSAQYTFIKLQEYFDLLKQFPNTLFVWVSHEKNKEPQGFLAQKILYDAMVKIRVVGYRAQIASRYIDGEGATMDVWSEGAEKFWSASF
jgi:AAA+ ATPase superfamily predicted ATPase